MAASPGRSSFEWDAYEDVDKPARHHERHDRGGSMRAPRRSERGDRGSSTRSSSARRSGSPCSRGSRSPRGAQGYSNEALVDGDEYFSDQADYEEHYLAKRQRQDSGASLTSRDAREPPVGASPVHAAAPPGGFEGIATYEQRRLLTAGKSMPQLNERVVPPQPQPRHRYECIPQRPAQQPPPPPARPGKAGHATPTRRCNSSAGGTPTRRDAPARSPSAASLLRRGGATPAGGVSTPAAARLVHAPVFTPTAVLSSPATSPMRPQAVPFVSPGSSRRNLTPLMNSMSPQPLPRTPRQQQQQHQQPQHSQYNHRRTLSMSSGSHHHQRTAVIAPSTYTGYDLSGRAYGDGSRGRCELEDDMAEMQASFLSHQHSLQSSLEPLMRRSPRRKSLSPGPSSATVSPTTATPPMDMQQLACGRGAVGPALRSANGSAACSPASYKSNKSSWLSLPGLGLGPARGLGGRAPRGVLFGTGIVLVVSGVVACVLSFYLLSQKGRQYYLDFGVLSAFASLMLGIIGLRARVAHLLPNRNYVTGYIMVAAFSVLTSAGLLALLLLPPPPHLPRAARLHSQNAAAATLDMAAGAVCGTAALTLLLAATGTLSSYCCRYPPPDNRVAHAVEGFSV